MVKDKLVSALGREPVETAPGTFFRIGTERMDIQQITLPGKGNDRHLAAIQTKIDGIRRFQLQHSLTGERVCFFEHIKAEFKRITDHT